MSFRKSSLIWMVLPIFLTSCEEIHGTIAFKKNGSGTVNLEIIYAENLKVKNVDSCREYMSNIKWNDIAYNSESSLNNPSGSDQCIYTYYFNDLIEVEKLHKGLNLNLQKLSISNNYFVYEANNQACVKDLDPDAFKSVTWSVESPGNISSHNAEKIIGNKLTWNISGFDCYTILVKSVLRQSEEVKGKADSVVTSDLPEHKDRVTPSTSPSSDKLNQPEDVKADTDSVVTSDLPEDKDRVTPSTLPSSDKAKKETLDSVVLWTTISASIATIIGTVIAYMTYKDSKSKR